MSTGEVLLGSELIIMMCQCDIGILYQSFIDYKINQFIFISFREDFMEIAQWVAECNIDPHIVEVIYALLDDNQDGSLSIKEFSPVLFQWRRSRGFEHATLRINMGNLSI